MSLPERDDVQDNAFGSNSESIKHTSNNFRRIGKWLNQNHGHVMA